MCEKIMYSLGTPAFFLLSMLFFSSGCAQLTPQSPDNKTQYAKQLAQAESLFISEKFPEALVEFEGVFYNSASVADKNSALYGLACSRLIIAEDGKAVVSAVKDLQQWDTNKGQEPFNENRHMLIMAVERMAFLIEELTESRMQKETQKDTLIADQKKKIGQLTSRVEKLQKQLEDLEAVEENFQGKRKPI